MIADGTMCKMNTLVYYRVLGIGRRHLVDVSAEVDVYMLSAVREACDKFGKWYQRFYVDIDGKTYTLSSFDWNVDEQAIDEIGKYMFNIKEDDNDD